jgi:hypothetical protein
MVGRKKNCLALARTLIPNSSAEAKTVAFATLDQIRLTSSASASDTDTAVKIASAVFQYFTRWIVPLLLSTQQ